MGASNELRGWRGLNLATDQEWRALCACLLEVHRAPTHEDVRYQVMCYLAQEIPFQSAAFFVTRRERRSHEGCFIAQPPGTDLPIGIFEGLVKTAKETSGEHDAIARASLDPASPFSAKCGGNALVCSFLDNVGPLATLVLCRTSAQGGFSDRDELLLRALEPHVSERLTRLGVGAGVATVRADLIAREYRLTPREVEVASCVAYGMTTPEIAAKLTISPTTAKKHLERVYRKTGVNNRMALMRLAQQYISTDNDR